MTSSHPSRPSRDLDQPRPTAFRASFSGSDALWPESARATVSSWSLDEIDELIASYGADSLSVLGISSPRSSTVSDDSHCGTASAPASEDTTPRRVAVVPPDHAHTLPRRRTPVQAAPGLDFRHLRTFIRLDSQARKPSDPETRHLDQPDSRSAVKTIQSSASPQYSNVVAISPSRVHSPRSSIPTPRNYQPCSHVVHNRKQNVLNVRKASNHTLMPPTDMPALISSRSQASKWSPASKFTTRAHASTSKARLESTVQPNYQTSKLSVLLRSIPLYTPPPTPDHLSVLTLTSTSDDSDASSISTECAVTPPFVPTSLDEASLGDSWFAPMDPAAEFADVAPDVCVVSATKIPETEQEPTVNVKPRHVRFHVESGPDRPTPLSGPAHTRATFVNPFPKTILNSRLSIHDRPPPPVPPKDPPTIRRKQRSIDLRNNERRNNLYDPTTIRQPTTYESRSSAEWQPVADTICSLVRDEHGKIVSGTLFALLFDVIRRPIDPSPTDPLADHELVIGFWAVFRHHGDPDFILYWVRRIYHEWSMGSDMLDKVDTIVRHVCWGWFGSWTPADQVYAARGVLEWIKEEVQPRNAAHATQLRAAFDGRNTHTVVRSPMRDINVCELERSDKALKPTVIGNIPANMSLHALARQGGDYLEEFVRQLTVIMNAPYETLPHPLMILTDWFLNLTDARELAMESHLRAICDQLHKWVSHSVLTASSSTQRFDIAIFWMKAGQMCFERYNLAAASAIFDGFQVVITPDVWKGREADYTDYKYDFMGIGRADTPFAASLREQKHFWTTAGGINGFRANRSYAEKMVEARDHPEYPFVPHLARHRAMVADLRAKLVTIRPNARPNPNLVLGWAEGGADVILDIDSMRSLAKLSHPIEWGYRRYGYIGNLKLQTWIRSQFRKMDEWAVPGCRDFSAWGMHAARTREKKPNLTTPEALLRTKMPKQPKPCNPPSAPVI